MSVSAQVGKPKLVMLLGAGASEALRLPGTKNLSDEVLRTMRINDGCGDLRGGLSEVITEIRASFPPRMEPLIDTIRKAHGYSNFEHDINLLENLVALSKPDALHQVQSPVAKLIHAKSAYEALFDDRVLQNMLDGIIQCLLDTLRTTEETMDPADIRAARTFAAEIADEFDVAIYNLNYDGIHDDALSDMNDGFERDPEEADLQRFSARKFFHNGGRRFAHVHGSIRFRVSRITADGASEYNVVKIDPASPPARPLLSWAASKTQAGDFTLIGSIITGLRKADKALSEPYASYAHALDADLQSAARVLIIGYGGSDLHLNWQLIRARQFHGNDWKPVWITHRPLSPNDMVFKLAAWMAGASTDRDVAAHFPEMAGVARLQQFSQLHLAGDGWKPDDESQVREIKAALH